ncbi:hypothetical protein GCM10023147_37770 [Tsukamurella soli]|uniref:Uncharacterized protein n=1 Tax=Tsukamurella soli TaxID=644556 RepID=A0ABP8K457_9ACTN
MGVTSYSRTASGCRRSALEDRADTDGDRSGPGDRRPEGLRGGGCRRQTGSGQQDRELLTADAGDHILRPAVGPDHSRGVAEDGVAGAGR